MLPGSPASFPSWNWHLEAAFHSPETTARFRATISRSKLPTCYFDTLPFVRPARSDFDSLTHSGSPRYAPDRYRNPVARLALSTSSPSSNLHSPLGPFGPFRIKAFDPIPGRKVRFPSAPDCLLLPSFNSILLASMPDHRSRLAKRSVACCSSDRELKTLKHPSNFRSPSGLSSLRIEALSRRLGLKSLPLCPARFPFAPR